MKKTHLLKIREDYAEAVASGLKTFEVRYNDRDYEVGDIVEFMVINSKGGLIFNHPIHSKQFEINYILSDFLGLKKDYVAFAIKPYVEDSNPKTRWGILGDVSIRFNAD